MNNYPDEIRVRFRTFDIIMYKRWPFKFKKVRYPDGQSKVATGAFSYYRSPKERAHAHQHFLFWEDEIRRRRIAEGADAYGVAVGSGPDPAASVPSGECQVPDVQA